jgi:DNA repair protein RecO (recombination protein O)
MNDSAVHLQSAFILRHKKYRETSIIIDVLTRDFGIVSIIARGVRKKKSKMAGVLLAFTSLKISYFGKNNLKVLTSAELDLPIIKLNGLSLYCGFYINELIAYFLYEHDPHPEVFVEYVKCLVQLNEAKDIEQVLRFFELNLMENIGYGIELNRDVYNNTVVKASENYLFNAELGMIESAKGFVSGETLLRLSTREALDKKALYEAKKLMRMMIDFHLQGKQLKSRAVLAKIIETL